MVRSKETFSKKGNVMHWSLVGLVICGWFVLLGLSAVLYAFAQAFREGNFEVEKENKGDNNGKK